MKADRLTKTFSWLLITLGPAVTIVLNIVLFGTAYYTDPIVFLSATLCTGLLSTGLTRVHLWLGVQVHKKWGLGAMSGKRLGIQLALYLITALFVTTLFFGYHWIGFPGYELRMENYKWALLIGFTADVVGTGFGTAIATHNEWRRTQLEKEQLEKLHLQSQLEVLKNQVNPHFLFNSLNSLSALISEDPQKAERFVDELSKVYRYLLRNSSMEWASLRAELDFITSYFHLLKTRYGDSVQLRVSVPETCHDFLVPPLTLQLLTENAVKHNLVQRDKPLLIEILTSDETRLTVRNNLQKKKQQYIVSHGIGLKNIAERYRLANGSALSVEETNGCFTVTLPLLAPAVTHQQS